MTALEVMEATNPIGSQCSLFGAGCPSDRMTRIVESFTGTLKAAGDALVSLADQLNGAAPVVLVVMAVLCALALSGVWFHGGREADSPSDERPHCGVQR